MKPGRIEPENFPVQHQGYPLKALEKVLLDLYKGSNNPFKGYPVTNVQVTDIKIIIVVNKIMEDSLPKQRKVYQHQQQAGYESGGLTIT